MNKTELQKMLSNELYIATDPLLTAMRSKARKLFVRYNQTSYDDIETRRTLIEELLGKAGKNLDIQAPFYCDYGSHIYTGDNVFMNFNCIILDCAEVSIGNNVLFGPNVQIYTAYHPVLASERIQGPELAAPITIEDNVWIGGGAIICKGVTVGENVTIGAGSVVTRDIPPNVFAAGNPCKVIRQLDS